MNNTGSPPTKRMRLSGEDLNRISKDEIIELYVKQQDLLEQLRGKSADTDKDSGEKCKINETSRRENVLVMRLATKEQELQQYAAQIAHIKKSQEDAAAKSLREALMDPAINLLFDKMRDELKETKDKLEQAQSELSAWKFTPDSQTGKKLMSRCRTLIAENQELGKQLSQGKVAQLEAELALQKKYSEDLKESQEELNEFVIQLDEEVEGMQSTIQLLQQQLNEARKELEKYKKLASDMDFKEKPRTSSEKESTRDKLERDITASESKLGKSPGRSFVKPEVGENGIIDHPDTPKSPNERSFENSEFVCKEECESDGENEGRNENGTPMDVDGVILNKGDQDGGATPTFSEHEIIDESQGSSAEQTPERESLENRGENTLGSESQNPSSVTGSAGRDESPMNGETYAVIDNGSDDEVEHVAQIVSTNDETGIDSENVDSQSYAGKAPRTPEGEFVDSSHNDETLDKIAKEESQAGEVEGILRDQGDTEKTIPEDSETRTKPDTDMTEAKSHHDIRPEVQSTEDGTSVVPNEAKVQAVATGTVTPTNMTEIHPKTPDLQQQQPQPVVKQELQMPTANGPQPVLPPIAHSLMQPTQVPIMGDPAAAYLMNPHFQQLPGAAHLAQQQALIAEQTALMYKTMLAQQQQQQLAMPDDKNVQIAEGVGAPKPGEDIRTAVNPLLQGMPYMDQSVAFLAQYKAMLAAQPMIVPGPDGKTPQMIAPGGLGLYPGLPLIQPSVMPGQPNAEHVAANSVPVSWPTSTNVTYTPHSLMPQGFLAHNPAGMMVYPGHSLTPQPVAAAPTATEIDKHHGSGDHGPISNGLPAQKTQEATEMNTPKDESQIMA